MISTKYHSLLQVFNAKEEECLADYIIKCSKMFHGLSVKQIRRLAWEYAKANSSYFPESWNTNMEAGLDWYYGLVKRNPQLRLRMPESTSIARASAFNLRNVESFFENYLSVLSEGDFLVDPSRIWNLDETTVNTVVPPTKVLLCEDLKQVGQTYSAEHSQLVTMCCCVNAVGNSLPPVYVFPRVNYEDHMLNGAPEGSIGLANSSGWMSSDLFAVALRHFIRYMNVSEENPGLLIMDNHESHLSLDTIDLAKKHGLTLLTFPPHCSYRMQPLDISVYGPFKKYYNVACNDWLLGHPDKSISIYDVASLSSMAFLKAFTPSTITSGFKKAGIFPVKREPFTDDDFLSIPTERPIELQSDSLSVSDDIFKRNPEASTNVRTNTYVTNLKQEPLAYIDSTVSQSA